MLPQHILDQFTRIPPGTTIKNKYYGVYNKILHRECFNDDRFTVEPQYFLPQAQWVPSIDSVVSYVIEVDGKPLLFVEIKPPSHLTTIMSRVVADEQMRDRFVTEPSRTRVTDTVPVDRWATDITTQGGHQQFMEVIDAVKQMAAAL